MNLNTLANKIGRRVLPATQPWVDCPPGRIRPGSGKPLIVATLPRSGTHMLIDLILNNFAAYRRTPLHITYRRLAIQRPDDDLAQAILDGGGYVVKTHHPTFGRLVGHDRDTEMLRRIAGAGFVVTTYRDPAQVARSISNLERARFAQHVAGDEGLTAETMREAQTEHDAFWAPFNPLVIPFDELKNRDMAGKLVRAIADHTGLTPDARLSLPPRKDARLTVYMQKAMTRLLGSWSPKINTTVGYKHYPRVRQVTESPGG